MSVSAERLVVAAGGGRPDADARLFEQRRRRTAGRPRPRHPCWRCRRRSRDRRGASGRRALRGTARRNSASFRQGMTTVTRGCRDTASPYRWGCRAPGGTRRRARLSSCRVRRTVGSARIAGRMEVAREGCGSCPRTRPRGTTCRRSSPAPRAVASASGSASATTTGGGCRNRSAPRSCARRPTATTRARPRRSASSRMSTTSRPGGARSMCAESTDACAAPPCRGRTATKTRTTSRSGRSRASSSRGVIRHQGLTYPLVAAAVEHARARGATAIEGYPLVTGGRQVIWDEMSVGPLGPFLAAGFEEVSHPTKRRVVMRLEL